MQRNILKTVLISSLTLLLTGTPINNLYAAEGAVETNVSLDESVSGTYYVNAQNGLKMRSAPSTDADVVTLLPYKAEITVTGAASDSWYQIEYDNQSGYVAANYITKSSAADTDEKTEDKGPQRTETQENANSSETAFADTTDTFGVTPVITALIAAIIIMAILALYTAYSFLKNGSDDDADHDDEYDNEYSTNEELIDDTIAYDDEYEYDDEDDDDD